MEKSNNLSPESIQNATPPVSSLSKQKNKLAVGLYVLLFAFLVATIFLAYQNYQLRQQILKKKKTTPVTTRTPVEPKVVSEPVIIYTEEIKAETTHARLWPTVRVMRKVGDKEPEKLIEIGEVGEFPHDFVLSPDKKSLLINLEAKLQLLDLKTKKLENLIMLRKKGNYRGAVFSPDGSRLFIWDQSYASSDREYFVHDFTIANKKDRIIKQGIHSEDNLYFHPIKWRDDNKIVIAGPGTEFSQLWSYDLTTNDLQRTPGDLWVGPISESGKLMGVSSYTVSDACNAKSGVAIGSYKIIEPVSGKQLGQIDNDKNVVSIVAFSPDDKEVLYTVKTPITTRKEWKEDWSDCDELYDTQEKTKLYYKKEIGLSDQGVLIDNPQTILSSWGVLRVGAKLEWRDDKNLIVVNGNVVVASDKPLRIVAEYYQ